MGLLARSAPATIECLAPAEAEVRAVLTSNSAEARRLKPYAIEGRKVIDAFYGFLEAPLDPDRVIQLRDALKEHERFLYAHL